MNEPVPLTSASFGPAVDADTGALCPTAGAPTDGEIRAAYLRDYERLVGLASWIVGSRGVAEELVQDTFVRLVERAPDLNDQAALSAYVRSAVVNRSRSRVRRLILERRTARDRRSALKQQGAALNQTEAGPDQALGDQAVRDAVASLPRRQRECVVLRFYADLTVDAIAEDLGISAGSVKTHLSRAMRTLATNLGTEAGQMTGEQHEQR